MDALKANNVEEEEEKNPSAPMITCHNKNKTHSQTMKESKDDYEEVQVFQKRQKKKKKKVPQLEQENILSEPMIMENLFGCEEKDLYDDLKLKEVKRPFESFQSFLFSPFTLCAPWCLMRKVYWQKDEQSEKMFNVASRRNSRARVKMKEKVI